MPPVFPPENVKSSFYLTCLDYRGISPLCLGSRGEYYWKEGTLYPCLHRLENQGVMASEWITPKNGKKRKYYKITSKGKKRLQEKVTEWKDFSSAVETIFATPRLLPV